MRTLIDFSKTPCIFEVTDEEFADYERRNAKEIERRRIMRGHDEAQALRNAKKRGAEAERQKWQAENERLRQEIAELQAQQVESQKSGTNW